MLKEGNAEAMVDVSSPLFKELATLLKTGSYLLAIGHVAIGPMCPVIKAYKVSKLCAATAKEPAVQVELPHMCSAYDVQLALLPPERQSLWLLELIEAQRLHG